MGSGYVVGSTIDYAVIIGYFIAILGFGSFFGRHSNTTKDFFFGGQRFSWWLVGFSLVATTVGSYSFVKYSAVAYKYGVSSTHSYLNDWFWMPLVMFGWIPIVYYSRVTSVPEYFERRQSSLDDLATYKGDVGQADDGNKRSSLNDHDGRVYIWRCGYPKRLHKHHIYNNPRRPHSDSPPGLPLTARHGKSRGAKDFSHECAEVHTDDHNSAGARFNAESTVG